MYYTFEFASKAPNYIRHALAVVTVGNGAPACPLLLDGHQSIIYTCRIALQMFIILGAP